jgi:hypothetical protein
LLLGGKLAQVVEEALEIVYCLVTNISFDSVKSRVIAQELF